jgi:hypothetical protein
MLKLFLPIIFPSWRFFSSIGPSPRIEFGFSASPEQLPLAWHRYSPLPDSLPWRDYLRRLVYNPEWNELLFINSCAERLLEGEGNESFYREEIARRLLGAINRGEISVPSNTSFLYFRIRAVYSEDAPPNAMGVMKDEVFLESPAYALAGLEARDGY